MRPHLSAHRTACREANRLASGCDPRVRGLAVVSGVIGIVVVVVGVIRPECTG
jgi:hypothetical protein